jgi:hypothetical protein
VSLTPYRRVSTKIRALRLGNKHRLSLLSDRIESRAGDIFKKQGLAREAAALVKKKHPLSCDKIIVVQEKEND